MSLSLSPGSLYSIMYSKVVEHGLYMKHCKVEVYLLEFKLSLHSNQKEIVAKQFSRAGSVGRYKHFTCFAQHTV